MPVQKSIDQFVVAMTKLTLILVLLPHLEFLNLLTGNAINVFEVVLQIDMSNHTEFQILLNLSHLLADLENNNTFLNYLEKLRSF